MVKSPPTNAGATGDAGLMPGSGQSPGEGNGDPLSSWGDERVGLERDR